MKYSVAIAALVTLSFALVTEALPTRRGVSDPQLLNFALTLEHLESAFYCQALACFSPSNFVAAGFPEWISDHEDTHVNFLSTALTTAGAQAVSPCEYNFPITDVTSFVALSAVLEAVGTTAYTGAAQFVNNKDYLTVAASILAVEACHEAWVNSAVKRSSAWDGPLKGLLGIYDRYTMRKLAELRSSGKDALFYKWFLDTSFSAFAHRTTLVLVANKSDNPNDSDKTNNSDKTNSSDKTNIPTIPNSNPTVDVNPKATINSL
ncbi:ferritin-like domain-containing protein [Mycena leptocephala]|nr:ferritin-like domain-containing protein [Mycena leptocephala]